MKKRILTVGAGIAILAFGLYACGTSSYPTSDNVTAGNTTLPRLSKVAETGNGAPSGAHYNLNIIGVPKNKKADMTDNNGHRIFVKLDGKSKILLSEGTEFAVLDANGTKGSAEFQLPNPDPDGDGVTEYSVYARALGKPGGSADMTTCAYEEVPVLDENGDPVLDENGDPVTELVLVCSTKILEVIRTPGKQKFQNVSEELLYIYVDLDGDGIDERHSLFDEALQDYFWDYDNKGLKLLQLRFYEVPTEVSDPA